MSTDNNETSAEEQYQQSISQYMAEANRRRQDELSTATTTLKMLCDPFAKIGVTMVTWSYDGSGDSGDIASLRFNTADKELSEKEFKKLCKQLTPEERKAITETELREAAWPFVPQGFEINDGGYGEVILNTATRVIRVEHNERCTEVNYSEEEY